MLSFPRDIKNEYYNNFGGHYLSIEEFFQFKKLIQGRWLVKDVPQLPYAFYPMEVASRTSDHLQEKESEEGKQEDQQNLADCDDEIDVENSRPSSPVELRSNVSEQDTEASGPENPGNVSIITQEEFDYEKNSNQNSELSRNRYVFNPLPIRKKSKKKHVPAEAKDQNYWRQRVKNNIAARKSREDRRRKEIEVVMQCESLLLENCKLRHENGLLQARVKVMEAFVHSKIDDKF
eukprot:gene10701-19471_t